MVLNIVPVMVLKTMSYIGISQVNLQLPTQSRDIQEHVSSHDDSKLLGLGHFQDTKNTVTSGRSQTHNDPAIHPSPWKSYGHVLHEVLKNSNSVNA